MIVPPIMKQIRQKVKSTMFRTGVSPIWTEDQSYRKVLNRKKLRLHLRNKSRKELQTTLVRK